MIHRQERIVISGKDAEQILKQGNEELQKRIEDGWRLESKSFVPKSIDCFSFVYCIEKMEINNPFPMENERRILH